MTTKKAIINLIYEVIESTNSMNYPEIQIKKSLDTIILGEGSDLDSLGLITFIVELEQKISETYNISFVLLDEELLQDTSGPYSNVIKLAMYIREKIGL